MADVSFQLPHNPDDFLRKPIVDDTGNNLFADAEETPPSAPETPYAAPQDTSREPAYRPVYATALPHRGTLILVLGLLGLIGSGLSLVAAIWNYHLVATLSLALSLTAAARGRIDLRGMKQKAIDPVGRTATTWGYLTGVLGTLVSIGICLEFLRKAVFTLLKIS